MKPATNTWKIWEEEMDEITLIQKKVFSKDPNSKSKEARDVARRMLLLTELFILKFMKGDFPDSKTVLRIRDKSEAAIQMTKRFEEGKNN